jgi:hypothetical protein
MSHLLGRRIDSFAAPGAQTLTRRSSASPRGRPRTSSCRPISSPRCSNPSRCLSFLVACFPCFAMSQLCFSVLINRIVLNRGNLRSSDPTRGRRCRSRRRLCLSRFGLLLWLIVAHQHTCFWASCSFSLANE